MGEAFVHTGSVYSHKVACMRMPEGPQSEDDWDHGPGEGDYSPSGRRRYSHCVSVPP